MIAVMCERHGFRDNSGSTVVMVSEHICTPHNRQSQELHLFRSVHFQALPCCLQYMYVVARQFVFPALALPLLLWLAACQRRAKKA